MKTRKGFQKIVKLVGETEGMEWTHYRAIRPRKLTLRIRGGTYEITRCRRTRVWIIETKPKGERLACLMYVHKYRYMRYFLMYVRSLAKECP